ncbi:S8 family serine peptidase [Candidatus Woesearchaeota archaeon]|nr:S8 family serine peptidase [Candidatus Woesearchaeota archaeon]
MKKRRNEFRSFVMTLGFFVVLAVGFIAFDAVHTDYSDRYGLAAGGQVDLAAVTSAVGEYNGYIVVLKTPSVVEQLSSEIKDVVAVEQSEKKAVQDVEKTPTPELNRKLADVRTEKQQKVSALAAKTELHLVKIKAEQESFARRIGKGDIVGKAVGLSAVESFDKTVNAVVVKDITVAEAKALAALPEVKKVYHNYKVEASLYESVPLIGADKVWQQDADGGQCASSGKECLTGKGVTIGIIDTGVDYTHKDLGGNYCPEGGYCGDKNCNSGTENSLSCPVDCETTFELGWPTTVNKEQFTPTIANIDNDPELEIISYSINLGYDGNHPKLFVFNSDGTPVNGFPQSMTGSFYSMPAVNDIDKDGSAEILVVADRQLHVFDNAGSYKPGFPLYINDFSHSTPAVADIDKDGDNEIVVGTGSFWEAGGQIYVFDAQGNVQPNWPQSLGDYRVHTSSPKLGDIDGDGKLEIVHGAISLFGKGKKSTVWAWHLDGTLLPNFPVQLQNDDLNMIDELSSVILTDGNNDGIDDIFVLSYQHKVYGIKGDGSFLPNWPIYIPSFLNPLNFIHADVDNDGMTEFVFLSIGSVNNKIYAYHPDTSALSGWPKSIASAISLGVSDVNQDGKTDVLVSYPLGQVYAFDTSFKVLNGWPKKLFGHGSYTPMVAQDIDGDGRTEIAVPGNDHSAFHVYEHSDTSTSSLPSQSLPAPSDVITLLPTSNSQGYSIEKQGSQVASVVATTSSSSATVSSTSSSGVCKVIGGYDFVNDDNDPMDDHGHGTHVAATAAGNGVLKGVAPDASIVAYKVLDSGGSGYWDDVIAAIERSIDPNQDGDTSDHLDVISLSLGGPGNPDDPVSTAIDSVVKRGVTAVIAAGNSGPTEQTIGSPGTSRKAITVGAVFKDQYKDVVYFSSRGPVEWNGQSMVKPDVAAPGVKICAAQWQNAFEDALGQTWLVDKCVDDEHIAISGTSMATPHVAGAAALLKQAHPDWTPLEIKAALKRSADDTEYSLIHEGTGVINTVRALSPSKGGSHSIPCVAEIFGGDVRGAFEVKGTALCRKSISFSYELLYKRVDSYGHDLINLQMLGKPQSKQVENGLLGVFDAEKYGLSDGLYVIVVRVRSDGDASEAHAYLRVKNFEITAIGQNLNYINGPVTIQSKVAIPKLDAYKVEFKKADSTQWSVACSGKGSYVPCLFHPLKMKTKVDNGMYDFRIVGSKNRVLYFGDIQQGAIMYELKLGWPQEVKLFASPLNTVRRGNEQILFMPVPQECVQTSSMDKAALSNTPGVLLNVPKNMKTQKVQFLPQALSSKSPSQTVAQTKDGQIAAGVRCWSENGGSLGIFNGRGSFKQLTILADGNTVPSSDLLSVYDDASSLVTYSKGLLDLKNERIVQQLSENRWSWDPIVYDMDKDGVNERVSMGDASGSNNYVLKIYQRDGSVKTGAIGEFSLLYIFPTIVEFNGQAYAGVVRGLGDNYIRDNVLYLGVYSDFKLYLDLYTKDAVLFSSIPIVQLSGSPVIFWEANFAVANVDGIDGDEFVFGGTYTDFNQFEQDRYNKDIYRPTLWIASPQTQSVNALSFEPGYAVTNIVPYKRQNTVALFVNLGVTWANQNDNSRLLSIDAQGTRHFDVTAVNAQSLLTGMSAADVNNDGKDELLVAYRSRWYDRNPSGVLIYQQDGTLLKTLNIPTFGQVDDIGLPPLVKDIDSDGKLDIVLQSLFWGKNFKGFGARFYAFSTDSQTSSSSWPMVLHDPQHTGRLCSRSFYADGDKDGFGSTTNKVLACEPPLGYIIDNTDCNDADATINPNKIFYKDFDKDGVGGTTITRACNAPQGHVAITGDCNDGNALMTPGRPETCDNLDNDCNGKIDDNRQCLKVDVASIQLITGGVGVQTLACPAGKIACGINRNAGALSSNVFCCPVSPSVLFTIGSADPLLPQGTSGSTVMCPAGKVVCGAKRGQITPAGGLALTQIRCCPAGGVTVNYNSKALGTWQADLTVKCSATQVMCGIRNGASNTPQGVAVTGIYCCPFS